MIGGSKRAHRVPMIDGAEMDAFTRWKNYLNWNPGERKAIKRQYNKRQRRMLKAEAERELERALCDEFIDLDLVNHTGAHRTDSWWFCRGDEVPYWLADEWVTEGDGWRWGCAGDKFHRDIAKYQGSGWRYRHERQWFNTRT